MAGSEQRGLAWMRTQRKDFGGGNRGSGYKWQFGESGTQVQFFFCTEGDEVYVPLIHLEQITSPKTKRTFTVERMCGRDTADDLPDVCPRCMSGDFEGPWSRSILAIYTECIYHDTQVARDGSKHPEWPLVTTGGLQVFREDVGKIQMISARFKMEDQLDALYVSGGASDEFGEEDAATPEVEPTLLNRRYRWVTTGSGQQRLDILRAGQIVKEFPSEVIEARATMPDLHTIVVQDWGDKLSGRNNPSKKTDEEAAATAVPATAAPAARASVESSPAVEAAGMPAPVEVLDF